MVKDDAGVCAPDPLPDVAASFPNMHGEAVPDLASTGKFDGERKLLKPMLDETTIAVCPVTSDPKEEEEATPLATDEGSPPSIAANAAF
jgi:hypothetical protein